MSVTREKVYTIQDIYDLPEGTRAELIDGQIYYKAFQTRTHQKLVSAISQRIANQVDLSNKTGEVYLSPFAVVLDEVSKNYVEPDISVICDLEKLDEKGCHGAPDWIVEVVSSDSHQMDYMIKLFAYESTGVREYWIVDKQKDRIIVYNFEQETIEEFTFKDKVKAGLFEQLEIDFSEIV